VTYRPTSIISEIQLAQRELQKMRERLSKEHEEHKKQLEACRKTIEESRKLLHSLEQAKLRTRDSAIDLVANKRGVVITLAGVPVEGKEAARPNRPSPRTLHIGTRAPGADPDQ
jgi:septal ring factor EnvC (AmiA/AmiB activator)